MAQSIPPVRRTSFGGVYTSCSVFSRPGDTAVRCFNIRPMPGGAIRLRGGWERRMAATAVPAGITFRQFHEFRRGTFSGGVFHLAQKKLAAGGRHQWYTLNLPLWTESFLLDVDDAYPLPDTLAIATVRDKVFFDNGRGYSGIIKPEPPLSSWDGTNLRYVGLQCTAEHGLPTAALTATAGFNNVQKGMAIWVGLHNTRTNHYSNAVQCLVGGTTDNRLDPGTGGTITVTGLQFIQHGAMSVAEQGEQFYVFYATADGFYTPYLILNAAGTDVFKVPISTGAATSASLSLTATDPKGFIFSQPHERPVDNFPPPCIADMCYQNGRVYYIHRSGSGATSVLQRFSYFVADADAPTVGWSAAADDYAEAEFVGVPEESFPLTNRKHVPSGELPLKVADLANRAQVLVLTKTHSFWLEEISSNLHVFERISENRGILDKRTYVRTPRGPMWVTQNQEIVLLHEDSMTLEVLSENYAELLHKEHYTGALGVAADYLLDPVNLIDRYQVWAEDGYFVIHDFQLERDQQRRSVSVAPAYSGKAFPILAARSVRDVNGIQYHLVASGPVWTHEGQPDTADIRTVDTDAGGFVVELTGDYISQWLDFSDPLLRKEITEVILIGDMAYSAQLHDRPVKVSWYSDLYTALPGVTDNILALVKHDQSPTDLSYIGKITEPHMRWMKYRCEFRGHSLDGPTPYYPCAPTAEGEFNVMNQVYSTLAQIAITVNPQGGNR